MPFPIAGADRGLRAMVDGVLWLHFHTGPAATTNSITGLGYSPVPLADSDWVLETINGQRRISYGRTIETPTPGSDWTAIANVGLWSTESLVASPTNRPALIRNALVDPRIMAMTNDTIQIPARALFIEVQ